MCWRMVIHVGLVSVRELRTDGVRNAMTGISLAAMAVASRESQTARPTTTAPQPAQAAQQISTSLLTPSPVYPPNRAASTRKASAPPAVTPSFSKLTTNAGFSGAPECPSKVAWNVNSHLN
jgi:hypothetical protein